MSWSERLLAVPDGMPWSRRVECLLQQQLASWPLLATHVQSLQVVQTRELLRGGNRVVLQHNPARRASSSAKVDARSVAERPCFLCEANLPAEERGLAFDSDLVVTLNPFPILPQHLSVVSRRHRPQAIDDELGRMLDLAQALGSDFVVFYNGPRCGASAPDHFHLQAGLAEGLPIWEEVVARPPSSPQIWTSFGRSCLLLRGASQGRLLQQARSFVAYLRKIVAEDSEPCLNLLCRAEGTGWQVLIFARRAHRPRCYNAPAGPKRYLLSPGALDMAGLLIAPDPADFERMDAELVARVYAEVSSPTQEILPWLQQQEAAGGH